MRDDAIQPAQREESLAEFLYERGGGKFWSGETTWQDRHRNEARQWIAYADLIDRLAAETARADTAEDALWRVRARVLTIVGGLEHGYWDAGRGVAARIRAVLDAAPGTAAGDAWRGHHGPRGSEWATGTSDDAGGAQ